MRVTSRCVARTGRGDMPAMDPGGPVMQESSALNWAIPHRLHVRQSVMHPAAVYIVTDTKTALVYR